MSSKVKPVITIAIIAVAVFAIAFLGISLSENAGKTDNQIQ